MTNPMEEFVPGKYREGKGTYSGPERRKNPPAPQDDGRWRLDKKVNIALLVGLSVQAAAGIWYAGKMDAMVADHNRRIVVLEAQRVADDRETATLKEGLAGTLAELKSDVRYIRERLIDRAR